MIDNLDKALLLTEELKAALPFDAYLAKSAILFIINQNVSPVPPSRIVVSNIRYMGDEGGIVCEIKQRGTDQLILLSLTHLRCHPSHSFAKAVAAYQKHRIKRLKKQARQSGLT
jgi:hypothetical protein